MKPPQIESKQIQWILKFLHDTDQAAFLQAFAAFAQEINFFEVSPLDLARGRDLALAEGYNEGWAACIDYVMRMLMDSPSPQARSLEDELDQFSDN